MDDRKMTPKPYSDKSSLPTDSSNDAIPGVPIEDLPQTPSPASLSGATTPSPTPQEYVPVENFVDTVTVQENHRIPDLAAITPCYPTPGDIMPYDHSLPDFIRQITNQPNLANLQSLSLRVISTLISVHRMSTYLPNLRELDLEGSVLSSLRDIGCSLKNLQILKVGRCQLESLDGTFGLSSLRELYAQKNFINDVSPCSNLPHIRHIDVSGNRIRNISYAGFLSVCNKLKSIVFAGNPATEVSGYRSHVRRILPQVETLDGIPFVEEDGEETVFKAEDSYSEGCESSPANAAEFSSASPSESATDLFKSEDPFLLDKKNKQAKNLANQDQSDTADCEKVSSDVKTGQLQDEFAKLNLHQNRVKKGFLGQAKNADNINVNIKQKCTRIRKLDKDIENRSKKSNLLLNANFACEESVVTSEEFPNCQVPGGDGPGSPSGSATAGEDESRKWPPTESPTATGSDSSDRNKAEEIKYGAIKKRPSSAVTRSRDEERTVDQTRSLNKLTTGLPVCGNLTAALRNRKKKNASSETNFFADTLRNAFDTAEVDIYGSGDNFETERCVPNEYNAIGEDVLTDSAKSSRTFAREKTGRKRESGGGGGGVQDEESKESDSTSDREQKRNESLLRTVN